MSNFEYSAEKPAQAIDSQRLALPQGSCRITIISTGTDGNGKPPYGILSFAVEPGSNNQNGARLVGEVRWQDVLIAEIDIPARGTSLVKAPIRGFAAPSALHFDVRIEYPAGRFDGDFRAHNVSWGTIRDLNFESTDDEGLAVLQRAVPAALSCARSLGLQGRYINSSKGVEFIEDVLAAIRMQIPYSVVRLGDGEGRVLGYPEVFSNQEVLDQVLYYHFGPESMHELKRIHPKTWIQHSMQELRTLLVRAIRSADALGLPVAEYFDGYKENPTAGMLGYYCASQAAVGLARHLPDRKMVGTNVFQLVAADGRLFREAARSAKRVYIVGPWDIRSELSTALGTTISDWIQVPSHYTWRDAKGPGHYPDLYKYVETRLRDIDDAAGCLFLVGAGILGKHYCHVAKELGGVALDVGSIFDSWAQKGRPDAVGNRSIRFDSFGATSVA